MAELNVKALGLSLGIIWSACCFLLGLTAMTGWGTSIVAALSSIYIGYDPTILGSIIGAIWAFADGFICGALIAWLYNKFQ